MLRNELFTRLDADEDGVVGYIGVNIGGQASAEIGVNTCQCSMPTPITGWLDPATC